MWGEFIAFPSASVLILAASPGVGVEMRKTLIPVFVPQVCVGGKRRKDEISVDSLDFSKKILHTTWHPHENIIAVAATNNLYIFQDKVN